MVRPSAKKNWVFTWNNYPQDYVEHIESITGENSDVSYVAMSEERGEEGTPHLQGYLQLKRKMRRRQVSRLLPHCYLAPQRGSVEENLNYVKGLVQKKGMIMNPTFLEIGTISLKGKRTDLDQIREMIEEGAQEESIATEFFSQWVRYRASFRAYRDLTTTPVTESTFTLNDYPEAWRTLEAFEWKKTLVLVGDSGIGKTEFAKVLLPGSLMVSHCDDLLKFDSNKHSGII